MVPFKLIKLSGRSGKLALIAGTAASAAVVGFFLQSGTPTEAASVQPEKVKKLAVPSEASIQIASSLGLTGQFLPKVPAEPEASLPVQPVALTLSEDTPIAALPREEPAPVLGCDIRVEAEATVAALVNLHIEATCMPNARIAISHEGLKFHEVLSDSGVLDITVPAFDELAEFGVSFPNGSEVFAETLVSSIVFYDRVALQWAGETGLQIHALEFEADYDTDGHVWFGNPRDLTAVVGGDGGFMMRMGAGDSEISRMADVYTFPIGNPSRDGNVVLSVEAEVNGANCNRAIAADTMQIHAGGDIATNRFEIAMPECGATGDFLVLKNLLEDLTIARNN
ncbi:translocase [Cognatishimia activa]|uniref:translocase n=1 Tax=Cognatishimia activa TaxID=1715691 RepID=UPI00222F6EAD|nr:translocase [Cognatishimia activa]UZD90665.1 translocase [Cognatishimia activa]